MKKTLLVGAVLTSLTMSAFTIPMVTYARNGADDTKAGTDIRREDRRQDRALEIKAGDDRGTQHARRNRGANSGRVNEGEAPRGCDSARDIAEGKCAVA